MPGGSTSHANAGRLAQFLGEVIVHHAPWTAEITEQAKAARVEAFLEELEAETTQRVGPLMATIRATGKVPPEMAPLFAAIADPTEQVGSIVQQFLVFGIGFAVASQLAQPFLQDLANTLWAVNPSKPLSPPDIATGVIRGIVPGTVADIANPDWATHEAAMSGIDADRMQFLTDVSASPPDATSLFEMIRRGIIDESQLHQAFRESDLRDNWIPYFSQLRYVTPTPIDMVRAAVQNQLPYPEAAELAAMLGLEPPDYIANNPDWFQLLYDIAGRPPGPVEAIQLANRGYIPWTGTGPDSVSVEQIITESDLKDKYAAVLPYLGVWWPSHTETRTLLVNGAITEAQAEQFWQAAGVPADLLPALLHQALVQQIDQEKALAKGDVTTLLYDGLISTATATELLQVVGYQGQAAAYIVEITEARRAMRIMDQTLRRVGMAYAANKVTAADAAAALSEMGVPSDQLPQIFQIWNAEKAIPDKLPGVSDLAKAVQYSGLPFATAVAKAQLLGYSHYDATIMIAAGSEQAPPQGFPPDDDVGVDV